MSTTGTQSCKKVSTLTDCYARIEFRLSSWEYRNSTEDIAKLLQKRADEFMAFLRDHRSQDVNDINIVRVHEDQCSACHAKWELYEEAGKTHCANCGVEVQQ